MAIRQINVKSKTCYFHNDLININFNNNKLRLDRKRCFRQWCLLYWIYNKKPQWHVFSVNPLYLTEGHFDKGSF